MCIRDSQVPALDTGPAYRANACKGNRIRAVTELNRDDPRLLHEQLADILRARIESGELTGRLETGHELARRYGGRSACRLAPLIQTR